MSTVRHCAYCHAPATKKCGKCKESYYCCVEHQTLVFKYHKLMCGEDNSIRIRSPNFVKYEAPLLMDFLKERDDLGKINWLPWSVKPQLSNIIEFFEQRVSNENGRPETNLQRKCRVNIIRCALLERITTEERLEMYRNTGLMPYYHDLRFLETIDESSTSVYYHPIFLEYFTYRTLSDIIQGQPQGSDANNYLMQSVDRLELLTTEAEKKGYDGEGIYRRELEMTRVHSLHALSTVLGVDREEEIYRRYAEILGPGYRLKEGGSNPYFVSVDEE